MDLPQKLPQKLTHNLAFMMHGVSLEYELYFDREMQALGLTRSQWMLLAHLYFCDGINQTALAELMGIGKGAIGRLAQKLEVKGWIVRLNDAVDGRAFNLAIPAKARPLVKKLVDMLILESERSLVSFSAAEVDALRAQLRRIRSNILDAPVSPKWRALKRQLLAEVRQLES